MRRLLQHFCRDERGSVLATEWMVLATILMLGAVAGLMAARDALLSDLNAATASR